MPPVYHDKKHSRYARRAPLQNAAGKANLNKEETVRMSNAAKELMQASVAPSTRMRKRRYVQKFLQWAENEGLRAGQVLPPSETVLCNYAASFAGRVAGDTAKAHVSAVKSWVVQKGFAWQGTERLRDVLNGVERAAPASSLRDQREPVKETDLEELCCKLTLQGDSEAANKDRCVLAMASSSFYGQMRLGEVAATSPSAEAYRSTSLPTVSSLSTPNKNGSQKLHLIKTKTQQRRGEDVVLTPQPGNASPTRALRRHIRHSSLKKEDPLFAYRLRDGSLQVLTRNAFLARINEIRGERGAKKVTGHCFRIGGTTHYLLRGVPPEVVKAMGRWKSNAFLKYWRDLDSLASVHLHRARVQRSFHERLKGRR